MSDRYAVIGNPVAHSLSPQIHHAFAAQTGEALRYEKIHCERDQFVAAATRFFAEGGKGLNVTVPFKQEACTFADTLAERAKRAQAVNTLIAHTQAHNRQLEGENSDGAGLIRDLTHNHGLALEEMHILVLGAGGAVRGVLAPLLAQNPVSLTLANRTADKAVHLAQHFADCGKVNALGLEDCAQHGPYDLIINGTAVGLNDTAPALPQGLFKPGACAYDMFYSAQPTAFLRWALAAGAEQAWDGFGMLVEQAAESFALWRGKRPQTVPVIRALRP